VATFHQQGQNVQQQFNADHIQIHSGTEGNLAALIAEVIRRLDQEPSQTGALRSVRADLESAREAETSGNRESAIQLLRRAAERAGPFAAVASGIATVIQAVTGVYG
jgi:serine/threonine protein kinase HipA of HipAB toxin-antitoxin module